MIFHPEGVHQLVRNVVRDGGFQVVHRRDGIGDKVVDEREAISPDVGNSDRLRIFRGQCSRDDTQRMSRRAGIERQIHVQAALAKAVLNLRENLGLELVAFRVIRRSSEEVRNRWALVPGLRRSLGQGTSRRKRTIGKIEKGIGRTGSNGRRERSGRRRNWSRSGCWSRRRLRGRSRCRRRPRSGRRLRSGSGLRLGLNRSGNRGDRIEPVPRGGACRSRWPRRVSEFSREQGPEHQRLIRNHRSRRLGQGNRSGRPGRGTLGFRWCHHRRDGRGRLSRRRRRIGGCGRCRGRLSRRCRGDRAEESDRHRGIGPPAKSKRRQEERFVLLQPFRMSGE